jgi:predicted nuclease with TOPRIM domain
MPTVNEIKREYGSEQAKLLNELFDLPAKAQGLDISMSNEVKESLGRKEFDAVRAAEAAVWAESERETLKTKYLELDLELRAAIEVRIAEIEEELSPKNASFRDFAAAAAASPGTLLAAMDLALASGDEDAALLSFAAGMQRDIEEVISHGLTLRDDWAGLYSELTEASSDLGIDAADKWETLAPPPPTKFDILHTPQSEINFFGGLR